MSTGVDSFHFLGTTLVSFARKAKSAELRNVISLRYCSDGGVRRVSGTNYH